MFSSSVHSLTIDVNSSVQDGRGVQISSEVGFSIKFPSKWEEWMCDTPRENTVCQEIRGGLLLVEGLYELSYNETGKILRLFFQQILI